jgi:glutamine synthetase
MADRIDGIVSKLRRDKIRFVRFEVADLHGTSRYKLVPIDKVASYARKGLNMYGGTLGLDTASSVVPGTGLHEEINYQDQMLMADWSTLVRVPWMDDTAKVICDGWIDGAPIAASPRVVLARLIGEANKLGFDVVMGHEFEFYFLTEEHQPLFQGVHIFNHVRNEFVPEITMLVEQLQAIGIDIITHNCEYAASQLEINYGPGKNLAGADKAFTFKNSVKEVTHRLGYHATFMSKPWSDRAGSGCHYHISLVNRRGGRNAFLDPKDKDGLSATCRSFVQGIIDHGPAMMPLINPTPNCHHRLKPHTFAPSRISWGIEDRTAMVRVKATKDENTHIEMRAASAVSNPYLSAAATLAAGLIGIKKKRKLQAPVKGPAEENSTLPLFPQSLEESIAALEADRDMVAMLGKELVHVFSVVKRYEIARFHAHVTDWERNEYMDVH